MHLDRKEDLNWLIELLETEKEVTWNQVTDLLQGFPSWLRMIDSMRTSLPIGNATFYRPMGLLILSRETVEQFIRVWKPYATLLSHFEEPMECVRKLDLLEGIQAKSFCLLCLEDQQKEIAHAAEQVLIAMKTSENLLRSAEAPDQTELLRSAGDPEIAHLLRPSDSEENPAKKIENEKRPYWFAKLFRRE